MFIKNIYMNRLNKILINKELVNYIWFYSCTGCLWYFEIYLKQIRATKIIDCGLVL